LKINDITNFDEVNLGKIFLTTTAIYKTAYC